MSGCYSLCYFDFWFLYWNPCPASTCTIWHIVSTLWKRRPKHLPQTVRSIGADSLWTTILFTDHVISHLHHLVCCLDVMQSLFCSQLATVLFPISKWTLNENAAPPNSQYISHQRAHWSGADPVQCIQVFYLLSKSPFSLISVSLATLSQIFVSFYFKRHFSSSDSITDTNDLLKSICTTLYVYNGACVFASYLETAAVLQRASSLPLQIYTWSRWGLLPFDAVIW